jgi:hypothetical protein
VAIKPNFSAVVGFAYVMILPAKILKRNVMVPCAAEGKKWRFGTLARTFLFALSSRGTRRRKMLVEHIAGSPTAPLRWFLCDGPKPIVYVQMGAFFTCPVGFIVFTHQRKDSIPDCEN